MNSEEEFLNTLKDCWDGRKYQNTNIVIKILKDYEGHITFEMTNLAHKRKRPFIRATVTRAIFRGYFERQGYERIK